MKILIVTTALRPGGKIATLAAALCEDFASLGAETDWLDLAHTPLPLCDGASCYTDERVQAATERVRAARGVVFCSPIYNYQLNSAAKNFVELTNAGWAGQVVGCVAHAGGEKSFLAPLTLLNSLMVDHRCLAVPRFVYATAADFTPEGTIDTLTGTRGRLKALAADVANLAAVWPGPVPASQPV